MGAYFAPVKTPAPRCSCILMSAALFDGLPEHFFKRLRSTHIQPRGSDAKHIPHHPRPAIRRRIAEPMRKSMEQARRALLAGMGGNLRRTPLRGKLALA